MQTNTQQLNNPEANNKLQKMLAREQHFKKFAKRTLLGVAVLSAILLIAGFLFFDSQSVPKSEQIAEEDDANATTASVGFKGTEKAEENKEDRFDFSMKKFEMNLFDFSEKPDLEDTENGIEYVFVDSVAEFEGSMGYSPNVDNNSPFRIVAIGLPAKTLSGTAASCYTGLKVEEGALPIDNEQTSEEDKTYKVLLPTTKEVEEKMQEEVDKVITKIVDSGENADYYDERREDIRAAAEVRKGLYVALDEKEKSDKSRSERTDEPIMAQVACISEDKKNKKSQKNSLHYGSRYGKLSL